METAETRELTSAFVPEEILRDFELKEVEKEGGPMWLHESLRDPDFSHSLPLHQHRRISFPESGSSSSRVTSHFRIYSGEHRKHNDWLCLRNHDSLLP